MGRVVVPSAPMPTGTPTAGQVVNVFSTAGGVLTLGYATLGTAATATVGTSAAQLHANGAALSATTISASGTSILAGKVSVGTGATTPASSLHVREGSPVLLLENPGVAGGYLRVNAGGHVMSVNAGYLSFETGATYPTGVGTERVRVTSSGRILFGTTTDNGTDIGQFNGSISATGLKLTTSSPPASATAAGTTGTLAYDASYVYVCTATNTWKRAALIAW